MVDFEEIMEETKEVNEELKLLTGIMFVPGKRLMVAVGRWWRNVNLKRQAEMQEKLLKWLKENEALV